MDRRDFLERLTGWLLALAGGSPLASHPASSTAWAAVFHSAAAVASNSHAERAGAVAGPVKYPAQGATLEGYLARPASGGPHPAVLLIHASSGLDEHMREVARRYAQQGYVALAVDPLSRRGGTASFASPDAARAAAAALPRVEISADVNAALQYLQSHPSVLRTRIVITGLSWGDHKAFLRAASNPDQHDAARLP